jgi:hypothetical protein
MEFVWVFHGSGGQYTSGVFSTRDNAEDWIATRGLSGLLTRYPLDLGAYDWAVEQGHFEPRREDQISAKFIQRFSDGSVHHHYKDGVRVA